MRVAKAVRALAMESLDGAGTIAAVGARPDDEVEPLAPGVRDEKTARSRGVMHVVPTLSLYRAGAYSVIGKAPCQCCPTWSTATPGKCWTKRRLRFSSLACSSRTSSK